MSRRVLIIVLTLAASASCAKAQTQTGGSTPLDSPVITPYYEFDPPPPGTTPAISASQAEAELPEPPDVTSITPILGVFTDLQSRLPSGALEFDHVLAWGIQRVGCFPVPVPSPPPGQFVSPRPCYTHDDTMIDATTGDFLEAFNTP